jgi:hypothetical protein
MSGEEGGRGKGKGEGSYGKAAFVVAACAGTGEEGRGDDAAGDLGCALAGLGIIVVVKVEEDRERCA